MKGNFLPWKHLVLVALILRSMLPAGWMPAASADTPIIICSIDPAHQKQSENKTPERSHLDKPCAFSGVPQFAATPDVPALTLPGLHTFAANTDRAYASFISAHHHPNSPRAPPPNV